MLELRLGLLRMAPHLPSLNTIFSLFLCIFSFLLPSTLLSGMSQCKLLLLKECDNNTSRLTVLSLSLKSLWKLTRSLIISYLIVISHYLLPYFLCEVYHRELFVPLKNREKNQYFSAWHNHSNFEVLVWNTFVFFPMVFYYIVFLLIYRSLFVTNLELILYSKWNLYSAGCWKIFFKFVA